VLHREKEARVYPRPNTKIFIDVSGH
jgi:hypothetical protein